jgi:hypothetical protein
VYLERPWWSSGEGELLGVLTWAGRAAPDDDTREHHKRDFTQWGLDPIQRHGSRGGPGAPLAAVPHIADFGLARATLDRADAPGVPFAVGVAGHEVLYDAERRIWYADVTIDCPDANAPFVRLALARWQPHAIPGAALSTSVVADFAQIAPDRSVVVTSDPQDPRALTVTVAGVAPLGPVVSAVDIRIERRRTDFSGELAWEEAPDDVATVQRLDPELRAGAIIWHGTITFAQAPPVDTFRLRVEEAERLQRDHAAGAHQPLGHRIVFVETVAVGG